MNVLVVQVARPVTLWALHFVAVYALISAACAPRQLLETDVMRATVGLVTLAAAGTALVWLLKAMRTARRVPEIAPSRPLVVAVIWCAAISLLAILANLWPVATLATCR